ncbi:MAG: DUF177 domain-containing protein [Ghiorsea sp.]|nr:DUF177 domain-containing protein [Ghiorsea sp.]
MSKKDKFNLILQEVARSGRQWDENVPFALLKDDSFTVLGKDTSETGGMSWKGQLTAKEGRFVLQGSWQMSVPRQCGRCNATFTAAMTGDIDVAYQLGSPEDVEQAELELKGDEPDILSSGELNVVDVLREHFWLAWQPMVVCAETCKGLCLQCGLDFNKGECDCHLKKKDNPFAALKDLKFDT